MCNIDPRAFGLPIFTPTHLFRVHSNVGHAKEGFLIGCLELACKRCVVMDIFYGLNMLHMYA
jgi:hypothetical protein